MMTVAQSDFVDAVKALVGTRYQHRGRIGGEALDCVGVPIAAMALCGVVLPEPQPYGTVPPSVVDGLRAVADEVPIEDRVDGDILAIMWAGEPRHLAVLVGTRNGRDVVVHAKANIGRVAMQTLPVNFRVHSCWRLREVC